MSRTPASRQWAAKRLRTCRYFIMVLAARSLDSCTSRYACTTPAMSNVPACRGTAPESWASSDRAFCRATSWLRVPRVCRFCFGPSCQLAYQTRPFRKIETRSPIRSYSRPACRPRGGRSCATASLPLEEPPDKAVPVEVEHAAVATRIESTSPMLWNSSCWKNPRSARAAPVLWTAPRCSSRGAKRKSPPQMRRAHVVVVGFTTSGSSKWPARAAAISAAFAWPPSWLAAAASLASESRCRHHCTQTTSTA